MKLKRWLYIFGPMVLVFVALTVTVQLAKPEVEKWVLSHLENLSQNDLPVIIRAKEFHLSLFLPKAELSGITITTKPELDMGEQKIEIDHVLAKLDLLQVLAGRLQISGILVEGLSTELNIDPFLKTDSKPAPLNWGPFFRALKKIPISRIALKEANIRILSPENKVDADLADFDLLIANEQDHLRGRFDLHDAEVGWGKLSTPLRLQTEVNLSPQGLDILDFRILGLGSLLHASASFTKLPYLFLAPEGSLHFEMKASLAPIANLFKQLKPLPPVTGTLDLTGNIEVSHGNLIGGGFRIFGQKMAFDDIELGQIETEGRISPEGVKIPHIALTHEGGVADATNVELGLVQEEGQIKSAQIKGHVKTDFVDLHELLAHLGAGDVPIEFFLAGQADCDGSLWPSLKVGCDVQATGDEFEVRAGKKSKKIIAQIGSLKAKGKVETNLEKFTFSADVEAGKDHGQSSGSVIYAEGFDISFSTPQLHFSNIQHLADLKLEGSAKISGKTSGNTDRAGFEMQADAQDVVFEDFILGQPHAVVRYQDGKLSFDNIQGNIGASTYEGHLLVDLDKDQLQAQIKSNRLELTDVVQVFDRRLKIPVEVLGTGVADVNLSGPLEVNHLTYQAKGQLSHVSMAGETFDQVVMRAHSDVGEFKIDQAELSKGKTRIEMSGEGHPNGQVNFLISGKDFPLEQSENISLLGANISGLLNFSVVISDYFRTPSVLLKSAVRNVVVEEQEFPSAEGQVRFAPTEMTGEATLVGEKLQTKFRVPYDDGPFALEIKAKDWNFTSLFALLGAGPLLSEYQSALTATVDLKSDHGGFWKSSGKGKVEKVFLKRGSLSLENPKPLEVTMRSGVFSFQNFLLQGPATQIEIWGDHNTRDKLDLRITAQTELRLFQIFLPFLEELSGRAKAAMNLGGSLDHPELLGSAQTENAFVRVKGFPHPFEKINSDIQFSQSRVLINEAKGELAGGTFQGEGSIAINGVRDFPTQIHAIASNVSIEVPDHVRTNGSLDMNITGNWFPFVLAGVYHVQSGLVDMELGGDNLQNSVKKSSYLPKMILQRAFEPIVFDLQVILDQPLVVRNSLVDGTVSGGLQIKGPPSNPSLLGQVNAEKGTKLLLKDKVFDVATATVKFSDPKEINPELYVSARSRVTDYDINVLVQGTAKSPIVRMSSIPPLSEPDIVSLLALGVTTSDTNIVKRTTQPNAQDNSSGSYQIGTAVLQQIPLFQKAQKATGFNVQFSSNYDDTKNEQVKVVTVSRQVSEKMKASASRLVGDQSTNEFKIQYSLNPTVSAIGTYQQRESSERQTLQNTQRDTESVLGLDLEYRKEFR